MISATQTGRALTGAPHRPDGISHVDERTYNMPLRGLRGRALLLEPWKALRHFTMSPRRIIDLARAALVPTQFEHGLIS